MARPKLWALLAIGIGALPAAADPPRDSLHPGIAEVWDAPDPRGMSLLTDTRRRSPAGSVSISRPSHSRSRTRRRLARARRTGEWILLGGRRHARDALHALRRAQGRTAPRPARPRAVAARERRLLDAPRAAASAGMAPVLLGSRRYRAGWVRLRGSFSGVPHNYASDAISLFNGVGGNVLTLPGSLTPATRRTRSPPRSRAAATARSTCSAIAPSSRCACARCRKAQPERADASTTARFPPGWALRIRNSDLGGTLRCARRSTTRPRPRAREHRAAATRREPRLAYNGSFDRNRESSLMLRSRSSCRPRADRRCAARARSRQRVEQRARGRRAQPALALARHGRVLLSASTQDADLLPPTIADVSLIRSTSRAGTPPRRSSQSAHARVDQRLVDVDLHRICGCCGCAVAYAEPRHQDRLHGLESQHGPVRLRRGRRERRGFRAGVRGHRPAAVPGSSWRYRNMPFGESRLTLTR